MVYISRLAEFTMYISLVTIAGLFLLFNHYHCLRMLKVIPGVPSIIYCDKNYVHSIVYNTRRYGRKSDYMLNLEFVTTEAFGTNVSVTALFYEYLHNEYRPSFVEWHGNLCTLIYNKLLSPLLRRAGLSTCPMPAAKYRLYNMSFDEEFPNIFPFEKGKGELIYRLEPSKKMLCRGDLVMTFQQRIV